jgi:hypothetical protein
MQSVLAAIESALDRRQVPAFAEGDLGDLAQKLGLSGPVSLKAILAALESLPYAVVTFASLNTETSHVEVTAQLGLQSNGMCSFWGTVTEHGLTGHNYAVVLSLVDVRDEAGNVLIFVQTGVTNGTLDAGPSTHSWQQDGSNGLIDIHWDVARNSRLFLQLHVSTNFWEALEAIVTGVAAAIGVVGATIVFGGGATCKLDSQNQNLVRCVPKGQDPN